MSLAGKTLTAGLRGPAPSADKRPRRLKCPKCEKKVCFRNGRCVRCGAAAP